MPLYKSHWVFLCYHGVKIWKKKQEKKKKRKRKRKKYDMMPPNGFFNEKFHQNVKKKKKKKLIFCYNILKAIAKIWEFLATFGLFF